MTASTEQKGLFDAIRRYITVKGDEYSVQTRTIGSAAYDRIGEVCAEFEQRLAEAEKEREALELVNTGLVNGIAHERQCYHSAQDRIAAMEQQLASAHQEARDQANIACEALAEQIAEYLTDDLLREIWRRKGGNFHGPNIETGTMPEILLLKYLRSLYTHPQQPAEPQEPVVGRALEAMSRAKLLPVWDSIPHALHVEIDVIFKSIVALSEQPQRPAVSAFLEIMDAAFEQEINRVSELEYNSNQICRKFYSELRKRLAAAPGMGE